ncbi:hypothetical protein GCM10007063_20960 [Lentibacillus kapialis]|uniref:Uncharacterized protein n=1 Tax=Lentibacillus kapialis TaxID=340214 RepID=A0A917PY81_9BACI|nr:hypothetical protein GCM10007063_20960 [Lentibacillus kapialis]
MADLAIVEASESKQIVTSFSGDKFECCSVTCTTCITDKILEQGLYILERVFSKVDYMEGVTGNMSFDSFT